MFYLVSVCLSVCQQPRVKITDRIFRKILPEMCPRTRKNWLNFRKSSTSESVCGNFWTTLKHCKVGNFSRIWLISQEKLIDLHKKFISDVSLHKKPPLNFESHQDPELGSGLQNLVRTLESGLDLPWQRPLLLEHSLFYCCRRATRCMVPLTKVSLCDDGKAEMSSVCSRLFHFKWRPWESCSHTHTHTHMPRSQAHLQELTVMWRSQTTAMSTGLSFSNWYHFLYLYLWGGLRPALRPSINCGPMRYPDITKG